MPKQKPRTKRHRRRGCLFALILLFVLLAALLIVFLLFRPTAERFLLEQQFPLEYEELILHYSAERDLDPFLVMGLIRAESSFRSQVVSPVGARGLMQIMPATGEWLAEQMGYSFEEEDLFNPAYNVRMGTYYLNHLIGLFEDVDTALAAYNAGTGNVQNWLADERFSDDGRTLHTIPFPETREYVERVNRYMETYKELYAE